MMRDVLALVLGGLGNDQTLAIQEIVRAISGVELYSPGGPDDYKMDILEAARLYPSKSIALIGHSLACDTVINAAGSLYPSRQVSYLGIIEPVWCVKQLPRVRTYDWFQCDASVDFPKANVLGALVTRIEKTNHNTICRSPIVLAQIKKRIEAL